MSADPAPGDDPVVDRLTERLRGLAAPAPDSLFDAVFDRRLRVDSLIGPVLVACSREGVSFLRAAGTTGDEAFRDAHRRRCGRPLRPGDAVPDGLEAALGGRAGGTAAVDLRGLSDFAREVLAATATIPVGETRSYAWVAAAAGRPQAVRAAGSVLARNPVPLLVPCHRVVRADGAPGRYIFGDDAKVRLLRHEDAAGGGDGVRPAPGTEHR